MSSSRCCYTTGRTVYQFHTRTKTGRAPPLDAAAPDAWVELSPDRRSSARHHEGDVVRVESPRGAIEVAARLCQAHDRAVFLPFHYGYWDPADADPSGAAAGQLTSSP